MASIVHNPHRAAYNYHPSQPQLTLESDGAWQGDFSFLQMADCQFGFFHTDNDGGATWKEEIALTRKMVSVINDTKPKFAIMCGDLTNATPVQKHYDAQVNTFVQLFKDVREDVPLICVCGNHDVGDSPTSFNISSYRKYFGRDYFSFYAGGCLCVVLNASLFCDSTNAESEYSEQMEWLRGEATSAKNHSFTHVFVFQHQPWYFDDPEEPTKYWSDYIASFFPPDTPSEKIEKLVESGRTKLVTIPLQRRQEVLSLLRGMGLRAIFAGHFHGNHVSISDGVETIITGPVGRPLGTSKSGYRQVRVRKDGIEHDFIQL